MESESDGERLIAHAFPQLYTTQRPKRNYFLFHLFYFMALICVIGYFKKHIIFKQILWEKIKISDAKIEFF